MTERANENEMWAWSALVVAFFQRNGRDPTEGEHDNLLTIAREMASIGQSVLH